MPQVISYEESSAVNRSMSKRALLEDDTTSKRLKPLAADVTWLHTLLFGEESGSWGTLKRGVDDQITVQKICREAGMRVSLVANPRAGVCVYTHSDREVLGELTPFLASSKNTKFMHCELNNPRGIVFFLSNRDLADTSLFTLV